MSLHGVGFPNRPGEKVNIVALLTVLIVVLCGSIGALAGGASATLLGNATKSPGVDAALGIAGLALVVYGELRWLGAPFLLVPLGLKSLVAAVPLPAAHQILRRAL
jgi:hypothetical protein